LSTFHFFAVNLICRKFSLTASGAASVDAGPHGYRTAERFAAPPQRLTITKSHRANLLQYELITFILLLRIAPRLKLQMT
jgi:hypothetical protein